MNYKDFIFELNGYLQALQRLAGSDFDIGVSENNKKNNVEQELKEEHDLTELKFIKESLSSEVEQVLSNKLLSHFSSCSENMKKMFCWDILEYFHLIQDSLSDESSKIEFSHYESLTGNSRYKEVTIIVANLFDRNISLVVACKNQRGQSN